MPGRTKLCYKKKSTKSNGSMQFISSRRNAHQKNRRTYSKFWMRMKREKSRNKSNYQHLQNVWNKTNTQLQQSQQENQELLAEQTLHEIERVSECDTDGDIDLYQAPYKLTEIDLIKIFELLQHCSYRALPRIIEICRMLSDDFVLPSNGWINKQKQVKQEMYNHAIIAYQTTMGTFKCDDLTMGTDGSGMDGHKFQTMNLTKPSGHEEKKFDHMVLGYKMLPRGDAEGIATVTKETFEEINAWRLHLNQEGFGGEHENDEIKRQSMDEDDVNVDGINNTSSPNESLLLCPSVKLQSQIQNMLMDGSTTEESAINKVFENVPLKSPRNIWKCLEHGKCDLFKGFMASLEDTRKENAHHIVSYEHGGISAMNQFMRLVGGTTHHEHNKRDSFYSYLLRETTKNTKYMKPELIKKYLIFPKSRVKNVAPLAVSGIIMMNALWQWIQAKGELYDNIYVNKIKEIILCKNVLHELFTINVVQQALFTNLDQKINQTTTMKCGGLYFIKIMKSMIKRNEYLDWRLMGNLTVHGLYAFGEENVALQCLKERWARSSQLNKRFVLIRKKKRIVRRGIDGHILLLQTICITLSILGSGWVYDYANPDLVLTQMIMLMEWKHSTNFAQLLKVGMNEMLFIEQYIMETYDTKTLCILSMMSGNEIGKSVKYMIKGGRGKFDHLISNKSALLQADNVVSSNDHTEGDNRGPKHIKQKKMRILTKNAMAEAVWSRNDTGRNLMDIKSENNTLFRTIVNRANEGSASGRYRALKNKRDEQLQALHEYEEQKLSQMKKDKQKRIQRKAQATESVELFENADAFIQKVQ
eukprot:755045_1